DAPTLRNYARVARLSNAQWVSEHIAFTRSGDIDLGHLNPVAPTPDNLQLLNDHIEQVHEATGLPVRLENITTQLRLSGSFSEPEFLNALCVSPHVGLLLDVTNLFINAHTHGFDAEQWVAELQPGIVRQMHIVGYGEERGRLVDDHRSPIQPELFDLMVAAAAGHEVEAVFVERDLDIPGPAEIVNELARVGSAFGGFLSDIGAHAPAERSCAAAAIRRRSRRGRARAWPDGRRCGHADRDRTHGAGLAGANAYRKTARRSGTDCASHVETAPRETYRDFQRLHVVALACRTPPAPGGHPRVSALPGRSRPPARSCRKDSNRDETLVEAIWRADSPKRQVAV